MSQAKSTNRMFYIALLAGFATLATHFYLSNHYFELQLGQSSGSAVCNINKTFNCDAVSASKYSSLLGLPIALWGFATQLILTLWTLIFGLGLSSNRLLVGRLAFYLSGFVTLVSVVMAGVSFFSLGTYCLFCMIAYGLSFVHWAALRSLQDKAPWSHFSHDLLAIGMQFKWLGITLISIVPLTFLFNGMFLDHYGGARMKDIVESSVIGWQGNPQIQFTNDGLSKGPSDAVMTIVEFADFLCPHCKHAVPSLKLFMDSGAKVRLVFKVFPLDGSCNASEQMPKGDGVRCLLSKTVFCAEKLAQKGWLFYEEIFAQQEKFHGTGLASELIKEMVQKQGLDVPAMESCRNSEETHKAILAQSQEGLKANISGTPSVFVNGRFLSGGHLLPVLQRVYSVLDQ